MAWSAVLPRLWVSLQATVRITAHSLWSFTYSYLYIYIFITTVSLRTSKGFSLGATLVAQMVKCLPAMQETWVQSLGQEDPLEKEMQPTPVFLPGKFHGWRSLVGYGPWDCKELDTTEQLHWFKGFSQHIPGWIPWVGQNQASSLFSW